QRSRSVGVIAASRGSGKFCRLQPGRDAKNPEARCRAGRPCLEGSKSRNRLSRTHAFSTLTDEKDMRRRLHVTRSQGTVVSRLIPLLAIGALLAACHDAERSV